MLPVDLAAEDDAHRELEPGVLERLRVACPHLADRIADDARDLEHAGRVPDADAVVVARLGDELADRLAGCEIAGRHQRDDAVADPFVDRQLAERADVIDARVGPRVREEDEPFVEAHCYAVGHARSLMRTARSGGE